MKNFYLALCMFIFIVFGSFASDIYVMNQLTMYKSFFTSINSADSATAEMRINLLKEKFEKQKNMLQLFINKEHIDSIETNIMLIENNTDESAEIIIETLCLISQITEDII